MLPRPPASTLFPYTTLFRSSQDMGDGFLSADAIANPPPFRRARAAVSYSGVARQMVQGLKYSDRTDLAPWMARWMRSEEHTSELQSQSNLVCRLLLEKKKNN